ncbi:MAG: flippase-like domain-containing protein [Muribaculaceae bacterium]|nr:flippase-like domain-containing protein [Muribaculaceae bacterium]
MKSTNKKQELLVFAKYIIPLIISVGLCYLLFTGIDFAEMVSIIRYQCDFRWIGLMLVISILSHIFRALRWGIQLSALDINVPKYALIFSIFGTYAVNLVFPRLGEFWRTGYIAQRQKKSFATVLGSMLSDRLTDTLTVILMTGITFILAADALTAYITENSSAYVAVVNILYSPWLWLTLLAIVVCVAIFMRRKTDNKIVRSLQNTIKNLWQGFVVILTMPRKGLWLLLTIGVWGCYFMQMYVSFYAFPFTENILHEYGALAVLVTFVMSSIAMGVPSNGGIGPWQWAVIFALGIYGLDKAPASAFANLVLGCNTLLLIVLGIVTFIGIAIDNKKQKNIN